jgi:hypothetical protein
MVKTTIKRVLVNLRKARETNTRRANPNTNFGITWSFEAHFNDASDEATTSGMIPDEAEKPSLMVKDYIEGDNMIVEYNPNSVFGDWD